MLASRLKHEENSNITSYASNGTRFLYNPEFIDSCSIEELSFILTNCVMHHILAHQQRKLKRKGYLWQLATDYAINILFRAYKDHKIGFIYALFFRLYTKLYTKKYFSS